MITITNDFHGTQARVRASIGDTLTPSQVRRAEKALCGMADCLCSSSLGHRGRQDGFAITSKSGRNGESIFKIEAIING